jgi:CubicO group peptidase (beta-lactamase class C family)
MTGSIRAKIRPYSSRLSALVTLLSLSCVSLSAPEAYPHGREPIGTVRQMYDGALTPDLAVSTFRNIDRLFATRTIRRSASPIALPIAKIPLGAVTFEAKGARLTLDDYLEKNRVSGILVLKGGEVKLERYRYGNTERTHWMSMSVAKSITSTLFGAALKQGRIRSLEDSVTRYVPALRGSAYDGVRVRDILMMSSGVKWNEKYTDSSSDRRHLLEAQIAQRSGGAMALMRTLPRAAPPGTMNTYSTGETQVASEVLRGAIGTSLSAYLGERIWQRVGMEADANWWLDSPDGTEIGGSGFSATLRDYGRFGLFVLHEGRVGKDSILPEGWLREATRPTTLRNGKRIDYGYFWWPSTTADGRRDHAFAAEGIFGQYIYINPATQVVIVVWGAQTKPSGGEVVSTDAFFSAVVRALR